MIKSLILFLITTSCLSQTAPSVFPAGFELPADVQKNELESFWRPISRKTSTPVCEPVWTQDDTICNGAALVTYDTKIEEAMNNTIREIKENFGVIPRMKKEEPKHEEPKKKKRSKIRRTTITETKVVPSTEHAGHDVINTITTETTDEAGGSSKTTKTTTTVIGKIAGDTKSSAEADVQDPSRALRYCRGGCCKKNNSCGSCCGKNKRRQNHCNRRSNWKHHHCKKREKKHKKQVEARKFDAQVYCSRMDDCWQSLMQARDASLCYVCSKENQRYIYQGKLIVTEEDCGSIMSKCYPFFADTLLYFDTLKSQRLNLDAKRKLADLLQNMEKAHLHRLIEKYAFETKHQQDSQQTANQLCARLIRVHKAPLFETIKALQEVVARTSPASGNRVLQCNDQNSNAFTDPFIGDVSILRPTDNMFTSFDGAHGTTLHWDNNNFRSCNMTLKFP